MIVHLIRHGKTIANEKRIYCGSTDIALSENGIKELIELKTQIAYPKGDLFITSGLLRAKQTVNILFDNPSIIDITTLKEIDFGEFEMKSYEELKENMSYENWIMDIENQSPPSGENKTDFTNRVIQGSVEVSCLCKDKSFSNPIIVTHGGVIATYMEFLFPKQRNFYEWQPACGRGYTVCFKDAHNIEYTKI